MENTSKTRYYLHGDEKEGNPGLYYCAFCDVFENIDHFYQEHPKDNDYERYLRTLKTWRFLNKAYSDLYRPNNAKNYFA